MNTRMQGNDGFLDERAGLQGKVAVVLGGGGGMGGGITLALARAGVDLAFCDIDADAVEATAKRGIRPERLSDRIHIYMYTQGVAR